MSPKLASLAEVAEILGVTKNTVLRYAKRPDFPVPIDRLAVGPIWNRDAIQAWGKANLPLSPGRPKKPRSRE